jgi:hypothetical protein
MIKKCIKHLSNIGSKIDSYITNTKNSVARTKGTDIYDAILFRMLYTEINKTQDKISNKLNMLKNACTKKERITTTAYVNRSNKLSINYYAGLCDTLDEYIYKNMFSNTGYKSYDGSYINSSLKMNDGLHCFKGLTVSLFDSDNNYPIDINLLNHRSERKGVLDNINKQSVSSIYIFDRGYEGTDFFKLINKEHSFVCRIKECTYDSLCDKSNISKEVCDFKLKHDKDKELYKIRYLKYTINKSVYCIATNLLDKKKYPLTCFADIYHKRWTIEEYFKTIKKNTTFSIMRELVKESLVKTIYCILFVSKLVYFIANCCNDKSDKSNKSKKTNKSNKTQIVNKNSLFDGVYDELLPRLFYCKKINKKFSMHFIKLFINIYVKLITTSLNISHPRIAKKACYIWYQKKYQKGTHAQNNTTEILIS